ncbi:MAG TPA: GxxExxY protein [Chlamydiales bacterium]|nr:GxxExxY protein [Chlamydiales bacterium]
MLIEQTTEKEILNHLASSIVGAAIKVHRVLGPGLLESSYEACLAYEISKLGYKVERQKPLPLIYEEVQLECGYRVDLLIENKIVVEVKAVSNLIPIHESQLLSYLKQSKCTLGLLLNFNVRLMRDGIKRMILSP